MIAITPFQSMSSRAFGWVQDPSNLRSLCDVVAVFDHNSETHQRILNYEIPIIVEERDGRADLLDALSVRPLKIKYSRLVGTSFMPRSSSRCNGIIQATVKGQGRPFIGDWPADNFVRWAHAFGFIKYNYSDDTFEITESGLELTRVRNDGGEICEDEKNLLISAILAYPPAIRILTLLASEENAHMTKFELGRRLGFVGEGGFTSLPQNILIRALSVAESNKEKNKMKADWDGSSDKYARMISKWLEKLGLVSQVPKQITVRVGNESYTETIGQAYMITAQGITALNRAQGNSRHRRIPKNICWEMFATKASDRDYLRTRRALIVKILNDRNILLSIDDIVNYLGINGLTESEETVKDDIRGLVNIGIDVVCRDERYKLNDKINDFIIPLKQQLTRSALSDIKDELRLKMSNIPHDYLALVDLAFDSDQNRLFEMQTLQLLTEECAFSGLHLGGGRKPDGVIFTQNLSDNYGVVIDTKAYSRGYNLPISQADEMERYLRENQTRDPLINPNKWWDNFDVNIEQFFFMFVSGSFTGNFKAQLERISRSVGVDGTVLAVRTLLLTAEMLKSGSLTHEMLRDEMFTNEEFVVEYTN